MATTLGSVEDINMANTNSQVVIIGQLQQIINQFISNGQVLENKITKIGIFKIKMPLIERFSSKKAKLKEFLT